MSHFESIKSALEYIDEHLGEPMSVESIAVRCHFSAYYFHRMFTVIVGKSLAAHIRERRLLRACAQLSAGGGSMTDIAMDCGFNSAQAFSRAFRAFTGLSPTEYRALAVTPSVISVEEMIVKFTNRLRGGIDLNPRIIRQPALCIAGTAGEGNKTAEVWAAFMALNAQKPLINAHSSNGYEIRLYEGDRATVHVGFSVPDAPTEPDYALFRLPASQYAVFDVYVAQGYESENSAMDEWLRTNREGYKERLLGGAHYCVEYYDERFNGEAADSIVEIWVPIEKG